MIRKRFAPISESGMSTVTIVEYSTHTHKICADTATPIPVVYTCKFVFGASLTMMKHKFIKVGENDILKTQKLDLIKVK